MTKRNAVSREKLSKFELSDSSINSFRENRNIPIDLYNKSGQVIMNKKRNPTETDFGKLLNFENQGVFFQISELSRVKLGNDFPDAKNVKLFDKNRTIKFAKESAIMLDQLKRESLTSEQALIVQNSVLEILNDFTSNPDYEVGLLNILEILSLAGVPLQSEILTKRTIVAMGMKVRTKKIENHYENKANKTDHLAIMTASYLADIGLTRISIVDQPSLSLEDCLVLKQHPTLSYLMTLPVSNISTGIRTLILNHHRPFRGNGLNNNFPDPRNVFSKLMTVRDVFVRDVSKSRIVNDIELQLKIQQNETTSLNREEDIAIISLASEYATLTSNQFWRPAFNSAKALKMILNDSFFSYSNKNIRHLLDYVGSSLTNNENIINPGDFVITASEDSKKLIHFDICKIINVNRFQTRPVIRRICTILPIFNKGNKYKISNFDASQIRMDRRKPIIDMSSHLANSQRIIYIIDPDINPTLFSAVYKLSTFN